MNRARWLVLALPWLLPALVVALQARPEGIDLRGPWQAAWAGGGQVVQLPTFFGRAGVVQPELTLRRDVPLQVVEPGAWLLVLGDLRSSLVRVHVNGQAVGDLGAFEGAQKADFNGLDAVEVPAGVLHEGSNVLELEVRSVVPTYAAIADRRLVLAPASTLAPWYLRTSRLESWLRAAPLLVFTLLGLLLLVLWRLHHDARERRLALRAFALVVAATIYLLLQTGLGLVGVVPLAARVQLLFIGVVGSITSFYEFALDYFEAFDARLGPVRWVTVNRALVAVLLVCLALVPYTLPYRTYSLWSFVLLFHMGAAATRALGRRRDLLRLLLASAMASFLVTGVVDLLTDLGVWQLPRLFALSLTNAPILVGTIVIGTFIALGEQNRALTTSLRESNEDLARALVEAREATRVKSEFLANVSHELRTPLNSIINIPEGLLEDFDTDQDGHTVFSGDASRTSRYLRTLHQSGVHLLGVVNQVLDFSKIEAGRLTLTLEQVQVNTLVEDVTRTLEPLAGKRGVRFEGAGALEGALHADPVKVAQVLLNLGSNAVKFSPDGGRVELSVERTATHVVFHVRDEGIGIAPAHQALIFEGFRQVEGGATRRFGGTGLGLAISRRLVELHGGTLTVASGVGQGSTFSAAFPVEPVRAGTLAQHAETSACVLVVDDEPLVHETLRLALRGLPYEVVAVLDPRAALEQVKRRRPALVILDVMMPRVSGVSLLRQLRAETDVAATPVLVLSAWPSNRELVEGLGATWLAKPFDTGQLLAAVGALVKSA